MRPYDLLGAKRYRKVHLPKVNCIKLLAGGTFPKYPVRKNGDIKLLQRHVTRTLSLLVVIISMRVQKGE